MGDIYQWIDSFKIPFKKTLIQRDFSDGVFMQEILRKLFHKEMSAIII